MIGRHAHTKKGYIHCVGLAPARASVLTATAAEERPVLHPLATCRASGFTRCLPVYC